MMPVSDPPMPRPARAPVTLPQMADLRRRAAHATLPTVVGGAATQQRFARLRQLAAVDARVLITGESGVGKELVASYLHAASGRARGPFVTVNCAGLSETLLESELFGHVKGSFTGAYRDKAGKFEIAHGGTLFLDEVGEMTARMQGMLLRVLATGEVQKVGSDRPVAGIDCRVIAATNRSLRDMIQAGTFREDLYYRLNVIGVRVPPLRERHEDIGLLIEYFLDRFRAQYRIDCEIDDEARARLRRYHWPGNVRQLENVMQRVVLDPLHHLAADDLPGETDLPGEAAGDRQERRCRVANTLYEQLKQGASFWDTVYEPYTQHALTRADLRELVRAGLTDARGNYRSLLAIFNIDGADYKRLLGFLRRQQCLLPFRQFR
jgi:transcriptional regulator with PAS, ATPase and Fis domain